MNKTQYTVRGIPDQVDRYLRKKAKVSGRSLNQVVIDELSESTGISRQSVADSLDWFYGSNTIGDDVIAALEEDDKIQKELTKKQWDQDDYNRH